MAERRVDGLAVANGARPRILITVTEESAPGQWDDYASDYAQAVQAAGGTPIPFYYGWYGRRAIPPHDGLLTIGGDDVDPARYGEPPDRRLGPISPARDEAELALTTLALAAHRPLLAICRGAQLLNVARGGSLHQHIQQRVPHRVQHGSDASGWHEVTVVPDSLLARIAGDGPLRVNSRHHQAVTPERLASTLVEAGRTDAGGLIVIEAIEAPDHPFALGVQWHPERPEMREDPALQPASTRLFKAFVAACVESRAKRQRP